MTTREYVEHYGDDTLQEEKKAYNKALCEEYPFLIPYNRWSGIKITEAQNGGYWPGAPEEIPEYDWEYTELDEMPEGWRIAFGDEMIKEIKDELVKYDALDSYRVEQIKEKFGELRWYDSNVPIGKLSEDYEIIARKQDELYLKYDWNKYYLIQDHVEHYKNPFIYDENGELIGIDHSEEIQEYNKDAITYYRLYKILEKCKISDIIAKYEDISMHTCIHCGAPATKMTTDWISPWCDRCADPAWRDTISIEDYFKKELDYEVEDEIEE